MSRYTLFEGSNDFIQNDGSALVNTETQIDNGTTKMGGNVAASGPLNSINVVTVNDDNDGRVVAGINNAVGPANWTETVTGALVFDGQAPWIGSIRLTGDTSHGLGVGDSVRIRNNSVYNGVYRVVKDINSSSYILNGKYSSSETAIAIDHAVALTGVGGAKKPVGYLATSRYATRMVPISIFNGSTTVDVMSTSASEYGRRKIHSQESVRTHLVATAIRAGGWDIYTGEFSPAVGTQNDFAAFGADDAVTDSPSGFGLLGEYAYRYGITTTTGNYPPDA